MYSTAEYCAAVWCCSSHTCLIDMVINYIFLVVTGCLRPTSLDNHPIFTGMQFTELHLRQCYFSVARFWYQPMALPHPSRPCQAASVTEVTTLCQLKNSSSSHQGSKHQCHTLGGSCLECTVAKQCLQTSLLHPWPDLNYWDWLCQVKLEEG